MLATKMTEEGRFGFLQFRKIPFLMVLVFLFGAFIRLVTFYNHDDFNRGYDDKAHYEYVVYLVSNWSFPPAEGGFEYSQPPLFYMFGSLAFYLSSFFSQIEPMRAVQFVSMLLGVANIFLVYLIAKEIFPDNYRIQLFTVTLASVLPVHILLSGMINNDTAVAFFVSLVFYFLVVYEKNPNLRNLVFLGVAGGLALLSKYWGVLVLPILVLYFLWRALEKRNLKHEAFNVSILVFVSMLTGGWWYIRNYLLYGNPFILKVPFFFDVIPPPHPAAYYLNFALDVFRYPFTSSTVNSFWTQTYATLWFDSPETLDYLPMEFNTAIGSLSLVAGILPTLCIIAGIFYLALDHNFRRKYRVMGIMFLFLTANLLAYAYYTYKYPFTSATNARFLLPALVPIALSGGIILDKLSRQKNKIIQLPFFLSLTALFPFAAIYFTPIGPSINCDAFQKEVAQAITKNTEVGHTYRGKVYTWENFWVGMTLFRNTETPYPEYGHQIYWPDGTPTNSFIPHDSFLKENWRTCRGEKIINVK